jgi:hypothetical protein
VDVGSKFPGKEMLMYLPKMRGKLVCNNNGGGVTKRGWVNLRGA